MIVLTNTFTAAAIQNETHWTLATERSVGVDTFAAFANARHDITFIQILSFRSTSGSAWAQFFKLGCQIQTNQDIRFY